jgi:hypothetical protein
LLRSGLQQNQQRRGKISRRSQLLAAKSAADHRYWQQNQQKITGTGSKISSKIKRRVQTAPSSNIN